MNAGAATLVLPARRRGLRLGTYWAIAALSFRQRLDERAVLWGRVMFYAVILMIYSRLWQALLGGPSAALGDPAIGQNPGSYVWYLAVTEWIMLSQPSLHLDIENDARGGEVSYHLSRPLSYVGAKLAAALGEMALRWVVLGVSGFLLATLFGGEPPTGMGLAWALLVGMLASVVVLLADAAIGLSAFWLHDSTPVYLIWQKLGFVLGGLMLPLGIYPEWLRLIAGFTPFPALLYGPGLLALHGSAEAALGLLLTLAAWGAVILAVVLGLEARARRNVCRYGG